jgi:hypothetical protein
MAKFDKKTPLKLFFLGEFPESAAQTHPFPREKWNAPMNVDVRGSRRLDY